MSESRRGFLRLIGGALLGGMASESLLACAAVAASSSGGRLSARPDRPRGSVKIGLQSLGLVATDDTRLYVPSSYRADKPATLIVGMHGATQDSDFTLYILREAAEANGHLLLAPKSRDVSWDFIRGGFGEDERLLDSALEWCFDRCNIDPARIVLAGFSDGATAALSLGLINGDLFTRLIAYSPGFILGDERHGKPPIFISHGRRDQILPIEDTSYRIVPLLKRQGYDVTFKEFDGPHRAPPDMIAASMAWLRTLAPVGR